MASVSDLNTVANSLDLFEVPAGLVKEYLDADQSVKLLIKKKLDSAISDSEIFVGNLCFKATKKEIKTFLSSFGQLKALRFSSPSKLKSKKFETEHAGYAIVRYGNIDSETFEKLQNSSFKKKQLNVRKNEKCGALFKPNISMEANNDGAESDTNEDALPLDDEINLLKSQIKSVLNQKNEKPLKEANQESEEKVTKESLKKKDDVKEDLKDKKMKNVSSHFVENDANEERTIYINNLPYTATQDDVRDVFKKFGDILYVRIINNAQGKSLGKAFVKYKLKESASAAIAQSGAQPLDTNSASVPLEGFNISVLGRQVYVYLAVAKDKAPSKTTEDTSEEVKKVLNYGLILEDHPLWNSLSKQDKARRKEAYAERMAKLKNPNYVLNSLRLNVRNLPVNLTKNELKKFLVDFCASNEEAAEALEVNFTSKKQLQRAAEKQISCTIILDKQKKKSKGYGFVTCSCHKLACVILNHLNQPLKFTKDCPKRHPLVEFTFEDQRALAKLKTSQKKRKVRKGRGVVQRSKKRQKLSSNDHA